MVWELILHARLPKNCNNGLQKLLNGVGKVNGQGEKDLKPRQSFKTGLSD